MFYLNSEYFQGVGRSVVGVTYAKSYKINSEKPAVVAKIYVVPGEEVEAGDLLVELVSNPLEMGIEKLDNRITALEAERMEKAKLIDSEVAYLRAQRGIKIEEINAEIVQISSELNLNRELAEKFVSDTLSSENSNVYQDPTKLQIASLDQKKILHTEAVNIQIMDIRAKFETEQMLLQNRINLLDKELLLMKEERKKLRKTAISDGVIDNVYVKEGEEIEPFSPILSVNSVHPTTVVGYLLGKKGPTVPIGHQVTVISYNNRNLQANGSIIGLGSVVELPSILQKSTASNAFGREVFIQIAPVNDFATGEKVLIK